MQITATLLGEHGLLYTQFDHLEQTLAAITTLGQVQSQVALLRAMLHSHAYLEDRLLFTALDPYLDELSPLQAMRLEHEGIEHALAALPHIQDLGKAYAGLQFIIAVARQHCAREEQVVYPLAIQTLSVAQLDCLGAQWARQRGVEVLGG